MNIEGIVFDLDGTLVDSEPLHGEAWLSALSDQGLVFEWEWFETWIGKSDKLLAETVIAEFSLTIEIEALRALKRNKYYNLVAKHLKLFPGVMEGLRFFSTKLPIGLATSSSATDVKAVFGAQPLAPLFRTIVHADHVMPNLKPAPDPYLLASQQLGINPENGIAMEDSVAGVKAAKTAGLFTIAICNSHAEEDLKAADRIFQTTSEGMDWIKTQL